MGRGLSRNGNCQGTWPLSSSEEGTGDRSQQDTQDLWVLHREPEGCPQPCHQPAPAPSGGLTPTADVEGEQAEPSWLLLRLSLGMYLSVTARLGRGVLSSTHTAERRPAPARRQSMGGRACSEPLGEGILQHLVPRPAFPASHRCCKQSKDNRFKAEERVLQAAAARLQRLPAARRKEQRG